MTPAAGRGVRHARVRCAIYTRKSSEEGLDQEFNSLQVQREACEAFINSQRHEGWVCLPAAFDDGGFSGATMERPALQRLLADITAGRVDIVVVYKIDRLTRSLADFAKIVEILDARDASFVSVTQQFNTTTSMGRLTLNVLLSFAQESIALLSLPLRPARISLISGNEFVVPRPRILGRPRAKAATSESTPVYTSHQPIASSRLPRHSESPGLSRSSARGSTSTAPWSCCRASCEAPRRCCATAARRKAVSRDRAWSREAGAACRRIPMPRFRRFTSPGGR